MFFTVTLPGAKYGVISAGFVIFTLVITDFGIAKVIGGRFNVLATDIFKQVIGQQNFEMGAVVGFVLLIPGGGRLRRRPHHPAPPGGAAVGARRAAGCPSPSRGATGACSRFCAIVGGLILGMLADGGLGVARHPLALQPGADAQELRVRRIRHQRLGRVLEFAGAGRLDGA